jgi:hypothetical protein
MMQPGWYRGPTIKLISCELQNTSGNTVIKIKSIIIFINITLLLLLLLLQSPHGARASTAISQMRPNIKTLDSTAIVCLCVTNQFTSKHCLDLFLCLGAYAHICERA